MIDAKEVYGQTEADAEEEARRLSDSFLHRGSFVVSAGDVVAYDSRYIVHRASCNRGSSGGALRPVDQPGLFYGTHIGAGSTHPATLDAVMASLPDVWTRLHVTRLPLAI